MSEKMIILLISLCIIALSCHAQGEEKPPTWVPTHEELKDRPWIAGPNEVIIGLNGVSMPLGRFLLARKDSEYCALKFTDTWLGETRYDHYTSYEFYSQSDGSGDFTKANVRSGTDVLFFPRRRGSFWGFLYAKGAKETFKCGSMNFEWLYIATLTSRDVMFAPTPWTSIDEVNVNDPRITWYKDDKRHIGLVLQIDRMWEETKEK